MSTHGPYILTGNVVPVSRAYAACAVAPACARMAETKEPKDRYLSVAGKHIRLRFFSEELAAAMMQAFAHAEVAPLSEADLTVHLFEGPLDSPWSRPEYLATTAEAGFTGVYVRGEGTLTLYDRREKIAYFWTHDAHALPRWVIAAPLRTLLSWFLAESGTQVVHGAAVAHEGRGVLFTARGGSGKSTTALSCALAGMHYLGDDYVGVTGGAESMLRSLYSSAKVHPAFARSALQLAGRTWDAEGEKTIAFLDAILAGSIGGSVPLAAIMIPVIARRSETTLVPVSSAQALLALAPTTLFQNPLARQDALETLGSIVRRTPCYRLELSSDSTEVARAVRDFLMDYA